MVFVVQDYTACIVQSSTLCISLQCTL